jgi:hypothetical protein
MREERRDDAPEAALKGVNPLDLGGEQRLELRRQIVDLVMME